MAHAHVAAGPLTPEEFGAQFDQFSEAVIRLETLPSYSVGGAEEERIQAWRDGLPRPERSVRTSPWLARIATTTVTKGKSWQRVRVVDEPLTEYQRYQLQSYVESQAAGEQVRIARRDQVSDDGPDFWLFDGVDGYAVVMRYDADGRWVGAERTEDPSVLRALAHRVSVVEKHTMTLNESLATVGA